MMIRTDTDALVDGLCRLLDIRLHHYDVCQYRDDPNTREPLDVPTCLAAYSEQFGRWQVMVKQDMSIILPSDSMDSLFELIKKCADALGLQEPEVIDRQAKKIKLKEEARLYLIENGGEKLLRDKILHRQ